MLRNKPSNGQELLRCEAEQLCRGSTAPAETGQSTCSLTEHACKFATANRVRTAAGRCWQPDHDNKELQRESTNHAALENKKKKTQALSKIEPKPSHKTSQERLRPSVEAAGCNVERWRQARQASNVQADHVEQLQQLQNNKQAPVLHKATADVLN